MESISVLKGAVVFSGRMMIGDSIYAAKTNEVYGRLRQLVVRCNSSSDFPEENSLTSNV